MKASEFRKLIREEVKKTLNEAKGSPYYKMGYQTGPNRKSGMLDRQSAEYKTIEAKAQQLATLLNDKDLMDFAKGAVDSAASSQGRYEGLITVADMLLGFVYMKKQLEKENP